MILVHFCRLSTIAEAATISGPAPAEGSPRPPSAVEQRAPMPGWGPWLIQLVERSEARWAPLRRSRDRADPDGARSSPPTAVLPPWLFAPSSSRLGMPPPAVCPSRRGGRGRRCGDRPSRIRLRRASRPRRRRAARPSTRAGRPGGLAKADDRGSCKCPGVPHE